MQAPSLQPGHKFKRLESFHCTARENSEIFNNGLRLAACFRVTDYITGNRDNECRDGFVFPLPHQYTGIHDTNLALLQFIRCSQLHKKLIGYLNVCMHDK